MTYDNNSPRFGRLRFFEMSKLVEDDIPNPLLQWAPDNTLRGGELTKVEDPLLAPRHLDQPALCGTQLAVGFL